MDWISGVDITKVAKTSAIRSKVDEEDDAELTDEEKSLIGRNFFCN